MQWLLFLVFRLQRAPGNLSVSKKCSSCARCSLRRLPAPAAQFSFSSSPSLPDGIPFDIIDPSVHLHRPIIFVTEKFVHILVQTICVQNFSGELRHIFQFFLSSLLILVCRTLFFRPLNSLQHHVFFFFFHNSSTRAQRHCHHLLGVGSNSSRQPPLALLRMTNKNMGFLKRSKR